MSTTADVANAVQDFVATIQAAITDPADAIKIFTSLASFPVPVATDSPIGRAQTQLTAALADLCRREAVCALAKSASYYQPNSYDDAANIRAAVVAIIENEITIAGDQGEDDTYQALVQLRTAVIQDLTARGASLSPLKTISMKASLPALTLAYRLYQDTSRSDQLVAFANPPHPAFMPTQFKALAT